jgi:RNA polymerase sigma-70 factor (ECF subfamily)
VQSDFSVISELFVECARDVRAEAWEAFIERFHRLISAIVFRTARRYQAPTPSLLEDLVQECYLKICANRQALLGKSHFENEEAAFGLIKVVASNVVHDHFKGVMATKRGAAAKEESLESKELAGGLPQLGTVTAIERSLLIREIDAILRNRLEGPNKQRDRIVFWLYYRQGLTADAIARLPAIRLSTKGVESILVRLTKLLRTEMSASAVNKSDKPTGNSF